MTTIAQTESQKYYSPEEYLELEVNAEERHEYLNGEIILMPGGTPNHNLICGNFNTALNVALKGQSYFVFATDLRLWIPEKRSYTYPDIMVVRGDLELQKGRKDAITNPVAIAEVLSTSTQAFDRGEKFKMYRTIPSFQEYLLIDQYSMHVEQYYKSEPNKWIFSEYDAPESILKLNAVPCELSLAELYDKVNFEEQVIDRDEN
jgi:Uma2 family endonuclease